MEYPTKNISPFAFVNSLSDMAVLIDEKSSIIFWNENFNEFLSSTSILTTEESRAYQEKEIYLTDILSQYENLGNIDKIQEVIDRESSCFSEEIKYENNGLQKWFKITVKPLEELTLILYSDISKYKQKEEELKNREIVELKKTKDELTKTKHEIESIFKSIQDGISVLNTDLTIKYTNNVMEDWYETNMPLKGKKCYDAYHNKNEPCTDCPTLRCLESGEVESQILKGPPDSEQKYVEIFTYPIIDKDSSVVEGVVEFVRDISERQELEDKMKIREEQYRKIFNMSPIGMLLEDAEGNILEVNDSLCEVTGYSKSELEGQTIFDKLVPTNQHQIAKNNIKKILNDNEFEFITENYRPNGEKYYLKLKETKIKLPNKGEGILSMQLDITDLKEKEKKLQYLSYHDELTGVYNRHFFEEELNRLDTKRQLPISLILADANGLKLINDTYGHSTGDQFLIKITEVMNSVIRSEDILARLGGDEFAIILPQTSKKEADKITNRIIEKCRQTYIEDINISIGLGTAVKTDIEQDIYNVFNKADSRMYQDKLTKGRSAKNKLVQNLLDALGSKSKESKEHAVRMTGLAFKLGEELNLSNEDLNSLNLLAVLHDIGKVTISEDILQKSDDLTPQEWEKIKKHPEKGYSITKATDEFSNIAKYILYHHERWDGGGYPEGLSGEEIPILSRIIAIIDAYDVMTHKRNYRKAVSNREALAEIKRCSGSQFDPYLAEKFIKIME